MIRRFSATWIYTLNSQPLKNGIISVDDEGEIVEITDTGGKLYETERLEHHSGIIVPGFVNAHCHLELSHLKGKIPQVTGMGNFLGHINRLRNADYEHMVKTVRQADHDMFRAGIRAVGDVSNSTLTLDVKSQSQIEYYTFVETFGFLPERAERAIDMANMIWSRFNDCGLKASIVPHSAYSVSGALFEEIRKLEDPLCSIVSVHNQESQAEDEFFRKGSGEIMCHLQNNLGMDTSLWKPTGENSLKSLVTFLPGNKKVLLIHNTFTTAADLLLLKDHIKAENIFLVLCPNSNLFIGNKLPPVDLFREYDMQICLGTDSLASNNRLSILAEMMAIQQNFPHIGLEELLTWACINGAKALDMDTKLGTLEVGKKPGLVLIKGVDLKTNKLNSNCQSVKLA